jgi:hypothetical protein
MFPLMIRLIFVAGFSVFRVRLPSGREKRSTIPGRSSYAPF